MPQLDPSSFPSQLFWLTVSFILLYVVMARYVLPHIQNVLESRKERIAHDLDRASMLKVEAENAKTAYELALSEARAHAHSLLVKTTEEVEKESARQLAELDKMLTRELGDAERQISASQQEAMNKLGPTTTNLIQKIVEKLVGYTPNEKEITAALASARQEREAKRLI